MRFTKSPKKIKIDDQPKINKIFKPKTSIEYDVSKLVAHDGLTFNQVASSSFIQAHLECTHKKTLNIVLKSPNEKFNLRLNMGF